MKLRPPSTKSSNLSYDVVLSVPNRMKEKSETINRVGSMTF